VRRGSFGNNRWTWNAKDANNLFLASLREHWDSFVSVARDEAPSFKLANVQKLAPNTKMPRAGNSKSSAEDLAGALDDEDDDLPF
jgi:hypothetical protein